MKKAKGGFWVTAIIFAILMIPLGIVLYTTYFAWDSQIEGNPYKVALEKEGKIYELSLNGNSLAFDKGTSDDQLYLNSPYYLAEIIALSYDDYKVEKTDNPFFAGTIRTQNQRKYFDQQTKYSTPKDSYQSYTFFDQNRNQIFSYELGFENDYVIKIRPTFPMFSKRKYGIGAKQSYIKVTKLLRDKLNKNLKIKTDENNKLLILNFEK
ncbi:MAG: hypothetical protein K1X72_11315 [Pyrinomonadaceae bacterium]|nr:hypothetical protein [Pyrinomonadaceae bacterium]